MSCLTDVCPLKVSVEDKIVSVALNYFCETFQSGQTQGSLNAPVGVDKFWIIFAANICRYIN